MPPGGGLVRQQGLRGQALFGEILFGSFLRFAWLCGAWTQDASPPPPSPSPLRSTALRWQALNRKITGKRFAPTARTVPAVSPGGAACMLIDAVTAMGEDSMPLMLRVLGSGTPEIWEHYPAKDAVDPLTACRWFYHTHAPRERDPEEHGHFHLFLHSSALPAAARPLALPPRPDPARADLVHIAGLSMDMAGLPRAWFATNRWVTDESLFPAKLVHAALARFDVRQSCEDMAVGEFLTAMVALYRRELGLLLGRRDRRLKRIGSRLRYEKGNPILASYPIDLDCALSRVQAELPRRKMQKGSVGVFFPNG